jgi:hypothetical protein
MLIMIAFLESRIEKMKKFNGACHCGKVAWSFDLPVTTVVQCHCENCRKMLGGDYSTWIAVPDKQFCVVTGKEVIAHYEFNDRSSKSFCPSCGTVVHGVNGKHFAGHKLVSLGTVEKYLEDLKPQIQVYTENKPEWGKIHGDVPVFS